MLPQWAVIDSDWANDVRNYFLLAGTIFGSVISAAHFVRKRFVAEVERVVKPHSDTIQTQIDLLVLAGEVRDHRLDAHMQAEQAEQTRMNDTLVHIDGNFQRLADHVDEHETRIRILEQKG